MKEYFECHITIDTTLLDEEEREELKRDIEETIPQGWSHSEITDDPILGPGSKAYATKHFNIKMSMHRVHAKTKAAADMLHDLRYKVGRVKIERVMYDAIRGRDFLKKEAA